ncbi:MAG: hypothetical protein J1F06_06050 [Prevotellaceae bacterium]|nr:hypothetical protein [Prevotellaceae bacterium]
MTIAVDFDGTIVEHEYPRIGKELPFACATLRQLTADGHKLVLWSVREGELLDEAVAWCRERGVNFYAVNQNFDEDAPEREKNANYSRKLKVQCFIDDRNVGGMLDWGVIYQLISKKVSIEDYIRNGGDIPERPEKKKRRFWPF